ncbi:hypothetical protein D3C81_2187180 [compost metagenome]
MTQRDHHIHSTVSGDVEEFAQLLFRQQHWTGHRASGQAFGMRGEHQVLGG